MHREAAPKRVFVALLLFALPVITGLSGGELPGIPIFTDDFNTPELFAENWEFSRGVRNEDGRATFLPSFSAMW